MLRKLLILISIFIFVFAANLSALESVKSGPWDWASTWSNDENASAIPDSNTVVVVNHDVDLRGGGTCRELYIRPSGRIHNGGLTVYGLVENKGTINGANEYHGMSMSIRGNLTNMGTYATESTWFTGSGLQTVSTNDTIRFGWARCLEKVERLAINGGITIADSYLLLRNAELYVDEYDDDLTIHMTTIDGGTINMSGNRLIGSGNQSIIGWKGSASYDAGHTSVINTRFAGIIYFYGVGDDIWGITIGNGVINEGTIYQTIPHGGGNSSINFDDTFVNNGIIKKHDSYYFNFIFNNGDFQNNGDLNITNLTFTGDHTFTNSYDTLAISELYGVDSSTNLDIIGDMIFNNTITIDMKGGNLNLGSANKLYSTYLWYNNLKNTHIDANYSTISFQTGENITMHDANIRSIYFRNDAYLSGHTEVIENGFLSNYSGFTAKLTIDSDFTNKGRIVKNSYGGSLYLNITGNIIHEGTEWSNWETYIVGTDQQSIKLESDSTIITGRVIFDSMIDGTSYQWQKDGVDLTNETSKTLTFANGLNTDSYGEYQCLVNGSWSRKITIFGGGTQTANDDEIKTVETFSLRQNYPNPFNPSTTIEFSIPEASFVNLTIYDLKGNIVDQLVNENKSVGNYKVHWNAENHPSGVYLYKIDASSFSNIKKCILVK